MWNNNQLEIESNRLEFLILSFSVLFKMESHLFKSFEKYKFV